MSPLPEIKNYDEHRRFGSANIKAVDTNKLIEELDKSPWFKIHQKSFVTLYPKKGYS